MPDLISIVIPVFNEEKQIVKNINTICEILGNAPFDYELIMVDDGSRDETWVKIIELNSDNEHIKAIRFSRNFGKEGAIFAGLKYSTGDAVVVMDSDLQHPPQMIIQMYEMWKQGVQVIEAVKSDRGKESKFSRMCANAFYRFLEILSKIEIRNGSDFRLMDRAVVDVLKEMPERQTFFRALSTWVGFSRERIFFQVAPREGDSSKWSKWRLFKLAINAITSFSNLPMQIVTMLGVVFFIFTIVFGIDTLYMFFSGAAQGGFTTVILLLLLIGSTLMLGIGILGIYIAKIYEEIKMRPRFIVSEKIL